VSFAHGCICAAMILLSAAILFLVHSTHSIKLEEVLAGGRFLKLNCPFKPGDGAIEWTYEHSPEMFAFVEAHTHGLNCKLHLLDSFHPANWFYLLVILYVNSDEDGEYTCMGHRWRVQHKKAAKLDGEHWTRLNKTEMRSSKSFWNWQYIATHMPIFKMCIFLFVYMFCVCQAVRINSKVSDASLNYVKIAFIMQYGNQVASLRRLRRELRK